MFSTGKRGGASTPSSDEFELVDKHEHAFAQAGLKPRDQLNALFENPLAGLSKKQLMRDVDEYGRKCRL